MSDEIMFGIPIFIAALMTAYCLYIDSKCECQRTKKTKLDLATLGIVVLCGAALIVLVILVAPIAAMIRTFQLIFKPREYYFEEPGL